jgi:hypothetical protein
MDLQEDYNPDTGRVIVGLPRSHHYNHSAFNDLLISGLVGLRPREDNVLEVNPLIPVDEPSAGGIDYFCLEGVAYHGHSVTILFDPFGDRYKRGKGLQVYVDGRQELKPSPLGRKLIPIPGPRLGGTPHPIDLAVNFAKKGFPAASASINSSTAEVSQAVDGRVWFYRGVRNYWTNAGSVAREDWFSVDFGAVKTIRSVNLSFFADGAKFRVPGDCRLQCWADSTWTEVANAVPRENCENLVTFPPVATSRLRVLFPNPRPAAVALVEIKVFE